MFCLILEYCEGGSLSSYAKTFPYRVSKKSKKQFTES